MCFAKKSYRDKFASAANSLPPTRSECDVGVPVSEPTISTLKIIGNLYKLSSRRKKRLNLTEVQKDNRLSTLKVLIGNVRFQVPYLSASR